MALASRRTFITGLGATVAGVALAGHALAVGPDTKEAPAMVDANTTLGELIANPAFGDGGRLLLPWYGRREDLGARLADVGAYMPYHDHFDVPTMLGAVNRLLSDAAEGRQVFYPVYSSEECAADPRKEEAGLFFFRGREGAPFAVVNPGGGFSYVGSLHESLPHAHVLSERGYNAFSLSYRAGSGDLAAEDLAAAVAFICTHADELGVSVDGYSLWGSSAGARMASVVGTYGTAAFGYPETPQASTVVMAYTGQSTYTPYDPPTYSVVGENDGIASARVMQRRIEALAAEGVPAEIEVFPHLGHGFGLGIGTSAEGWVDDAVAFWEQEGLGGAQTVDEALAVEEQGQTVDAQLMVPASGTVLNTQVDATAPQTFYLWEEGRAPAATVYEENPGTFFDDPDFRPSVTSYPSAAVPPKGAVLLCSGGAFQFRSDGNEGSAVARELAALGYQAFVVDYRLRPFTQQEGALDLARAVRFVRSHAGDYGIDPARIAVMGFSAGGILAGEMLLHWSGSVTPDALDPAYVPDELDAVSAEAAACGMVYSFYGRLSVASADVAEFAAAGLPPTYFCYGTRDPFVDQFELCAEALVEAGVEVDELVMQGMGHGYGALGGWIPTYDAWLEGVFGRA